jgi:pimeloyl-ACP methyl ester carboxylesterase
VRTETKFNDNTKPYSCDFDVDATTLLIAFGGVFGGLGIPPFEFFRLASAIPTKRLFIRDLRQAWYHRGVPGMGSDIPSMAREITRFVDESGASRVVMTGNSAGGYAALLFGSLTDADEVVAFSPQTTLSLLSRLRTLERKWISILVPLELRGQLDRRYADLRSFLGKHTPPASTVHYSSGNRLDRLYATRLADVDGVKLVAHPGDSHDLVRHLRDSGDLSRILESALRVLP